MRSPMLSNVASKVPSNLGAGRANNFNLLRFIAATLVIFSHCFAIAYGSKPEPLLRLTGSLETGGSLGVLIFFSISGYLITQSFVTMRGDLKSFLTARALRIYPGLVAAVLFSIVVAGFTTTLSWRDFLLDPATQRFFIRNSLAYRTDLLLPGAFAHNPLPGQVNGSLWTLPLELQMYILCAAFGLLGLFSAREIFNGVFVSLMVIVASVDGAALPLIVDHPEASRLAIAFLFGALFFINRPSVPVSIPLALVLAAAMLLGHKLPHIRFLYIPAVAYIILVVAYHPKLYFPAFARWGDYSYGLYIYAFPIQQLIGFYQQGIGPFRLFCFAFPLVLLAGVLSWHFIEKPALRRKSSPADPRKERMNITP